jgi:phospholipase D1/2
MYLKHVLVDSTRYWSHHEKVVVVDNHFACIGGLDLCFGSLSMHFFRPLT